MMRSDIIRKRGYEDNIQSDDLSLEISSYPVTAQYLAKRIHSPDYKNACELCCGIGVSIMEFSRYFERVIGVDKDQNIIEFAQKNIFTKYINNIELKVGDISSVDILSNINADVVMYDIPYWSNHNGMIDEINPNLKEIIDKIQKYITQQIVIYTSPYTRYESILEICKRFEFQEVWIDGRHDRNFIFLGALVEKSGKTKVELSIK